MSRKFGFNPDQRRDIGNRIAQVVKEEYNTDAEFYEDYQIPQGTFGHNKKGKVTIEFLTKFCSDFDISLDWMIRGIPPKSLKRKLKSKFENPTD